MSISARGLIVLWGACALWFASQGWPATCAAFAVNALAMVPPAHDIRLARAPCWFARYIELASLLVTSVILGIFYDAGWFG